MRILILGLLFVLTAGAAFAETLIPDRRLSISRNIDFYGGDVQSIFEMTQNACARACLADQNCKAFTYNQRSSACFLKSDVERTEAYEGAVSARVLEVPQAVVTKANTRAAELEFLKDYDLQSAFTQANSLSDRYTAGEFTLQSYLDAATRERNALKFDVARRFMGAALTLSDASDLWLQFSRDAMNAAGEVKDRSRQLNAVALDAAINSYLRAADGAQQVTSLDILAAALEANGRGRDMIAPLRLAQRIQPRDDIDKKLQRAIRLFGFSLAESKVETVAAEPRICAIFSEALSKTVDYSPYVQSDRNGISVEASDRQLCIAGLTYGERHSFTFREGLPAASGEVLQKSVEITQYIRDRDPSLRFAGRAYVLPATSEAAVPITAVNVDEIDLTLYRVAERNILRTMQEGYFGKPLTGFQLSQFRRELGAEIWQGVGEINTSLNEDVTTRLPVGEIVGPMEPGIYALQAAIPGADSYDNPPTTQWFIISDLGLTTMQGTDGLHVFVRGLSDAGPRAGAEVTLLSRANAPLGTATTNAEGYAAFPPGLLRGKAAARPGMISVVMEKDFAFLSLTDPEFDLSDRGVEGRPAAPPIDVFLTTERTAYRTGETIHALALARDAKASAIRDLPLTAILTRPDGVEYSRTTLQDEGAGGRLFKLPLAESAPRGTWRLAVHSDADATPLADTRILVEDFLPERIDVALTLPEGPISLSQLPELGVQADYLFGAPGADLPVEGSFLLKAADSLDAFPGFKFGRHDQAFAPRRNSLQAGQTTGADGAALLALRPPEIAAEIMQPLEGVVTVQVREGSNRPVERQITRPVLTGTPLIGIKPLADGVVAEGSDAAFEILALGPDLTPIPMKLRWTLNRVETRYQWYSNFGNWFWDPVTTRTRIAGGELEMDGSATPTQVSGAVDWGQYELRVERIDGTYVASSVAFNAGWYAPAEAASTPDLLEASLDQPGYAPGDTAQLRIVPRSAGLALVTVMSNRLIDMSLVEVGEGENLIDLPVTDDWGAGVYVAAQVVRPSSTVAERVPTRALGLAYAQVDPGPAQLSASFEAPLEAAPRGPLDVALRIEGAAPGDEVYAMIAAVDVGILNLTGFEAPDPSAHYFGQRKLGMGLRDIYGRLIDAQTGALGRVRSGGDGQAGLKSQSNPPVEELVAYVSGPLQVGSDGTVSTSFELPSFNGTVRLMGVVWSDKGVGQASQDVLVRDPVVVTATLPRFLAPGDQSQLLLELVHATGPTGQMGLTLTANGLDLSSAGPSSVTLGAQQKQTLSIPIFATQPGIASVEIALVTPDDKVLRKTLTLPIRRNDPVIQRRTQLDLFAGSAFTLDQNVFAGFVPGTGKATVSAGPLARLDAPGLLQALDQYPYGCTEQVTSRALPLLYLGQVANAMQLETRENLNTRISQAVEQVLTNQSGNGSFGLWRPGRGDLWLDAYVTDFLSRADDQGHTVPEKALRSALDNLRNQVNAAADFERGGEGIAYALYVLARRGAASIGDLRYYADARADAFGSPMALAQIGAALAAYGDPTRADAMFRRASARLDQASPTGQRWRDDYGTPLRDAAAVLTLAVEAGSNAIDLETVAARISPASGQLIGRSTQESVWSLLAANALLDTASGLELNGSPVTGPLVQVLEQEAQTPISIRNGGQSDTVITLTAFGVSAEPVAAGGNGYAIRREYFSLEGERADIKQVASGTRLVTVLTVDPFTDGEGRLMVNDPLPAGLEIDNPSLLRGGDVKSLDWLKLEANVQNAEFRRDRFLAAVDHRGEAKPFQLAYIVRAIAPGDYHHPAASVEDMYRPAYRAQTDEGRMQVTR